MSSGSTILLSRLEKGREAPCQELPSVPILKVEQAKLAGKTYFRRPKGPWTTISVDLVGPLPLSQFSYRFLVVLQDTFSKYTELAPIGAATAKNVSAKLKSLLLRYGGPETMICDNGTHFVSNIKYLTKEWSVQLQTTAPYSPQSNPVERSNRVVKTMIAQYVRDNQNTWNLHLEELQMPSTQRSTTRLGTHENLFKDSEDPFFSFFCCPK